MTVPTTNVGLSHIQTEFGGANPISLSEYYAGGTYVPTGQKNSSNVSVPTSGTISIGNFTGATKVTLAASLPASFSMFDFAISPTNALTSLLVNNDGTYETYVGGFLQDSGTWKTGSGTVGDYQVRLTKTSGNNPTGSALATWITLSSSAAWYINETRDGYYSNAFTGTLEIRMTASPNTVLDSASVTMQAEVEI